MKYEVIIKTELADRPKDHELSAALILAQHFKADVVFLRPKLDKTPDIKINNLKWEIKSPKGSGKKTIENNLREASKQSQNIIMDLRRIKMHQARAIARIRFFLSKSHRLRRLLVITKSGKVLKFYGQNSTIKE